MKQLKAKKIIAITFYTLLLLVLVAAACIGFYAYSLINSPDYITIGLGESYTLTPSSDDYLVRSYNPDIVTPANGSTITGVELGDAVVGIKYSYFKRDFYRFKVIEAPKSVELNYSEVCLGEGEIKTLRAACNNKNHRFGLTFSSADEKVATINSVGTITAIAAGECEIYVTAYNGVQSSCHVTVLKAPTSITLNQSSLTLGVGEEFELECSFPDSEFTNTITYTSSDSEIISITNGNLLTAMKKGKCTVTATTHNNVTAQCEITVKEIPKKAKLLALDKYDIDTTVKLDLYMGKDSHAHNYDISVSDPTVLEPDAQDPMLLHPKSKGSATVTATLSNGVTAQKQITVNDYTKNLISFTSLNQFPTLPTGCEVVSLTSVLNHYGFDVSMTTMADKYMPRVESGAYNISPNDYFIGSPYDKEGLGCYPGCIVKTAQNYFEDKGVNNYYALDITGCSTDELYNYLNNNIPVITWVTSGFSNVEYNGSWIANGETFIWYEHEHCLVTIGYDKNAHTVTVADNSGGYNYTVSMSQYESVFKGMGSMAVVILKK